jgi:hypothetical protein
MTHKIVPRQSIETLESDSRVKRRYHFAGLDILVILTIDNIGKITGFIAKMKGISRKNMRHHYTYSDSDISHR